MGPNPESSPSLLTINPSALLFNQIQAASIQNNSIAPSSLNPSSEITARGFLGVSDGKSLLLVGGDINMDGGALWGHNCLQAFSIAPSKVALKLLMFRLQVFTPVPAQYQI